MLYFTYWEIGIVAAFFVVDLIIQIYYGEKLNNCQEYIKFVHHVLKNSIKTNEEARLVCIKKIVQDIEDKKYITKG